MNYEESLTKLWAWQYWYRITDDQGGHFGTSVLKRGFDSAPGSLGSRSRHAVRRVSLLGKRIVCGTVVPTNSTGDHPFSISEGGTQSIENFAPLCKSCSFSKGDKDLLEWWTEGRQRTISMLNLDALCVYLRLTYQMLERQSMLQNEAPGYFEKAVQQATMNFPPELTGYFRN